jgi:hypothetical protein
MKKETLQQHKEATLVCGKISSKIEAINNLSIPQNSKTILAQKPQTITKKIGMYYINCHRTNHNVENYRVKRKEDHVPIVFEVTTQQIKV